MDLNALLNSTSALVDDAIGRYLPAFASPAAHLAEAMRYMLTGGKRVRPLLVRQAAQTFGLAADEVLPTACAFELLHTATLIHDDLPCIDDSPLRRGQPSCHVAFDEATAVLAGDALIVSAYAALADQGQHSPPARVVRVVEEFSRAVHAVLAGEAADIRAEHLPPDAELLEYIHRNKTAALFVGCARSGGVLAGASEEDLDLLGRYGETLGLLFQVTDDLLDATGEARELGKPAGADVAAGKQSYPAVFGLEGARWRARKLMTQALEIAQQMPGNQHFWLALPEMLMERNN